MIITPEMLMREPTAKPIMETFELFLMENPVCNPITETNREVPSFEMIFIVPCTFDIISELPFQISRFMRKPTKIDANRIPAILSEIPFIRILPIARPATIIKNRRLRGERNIVRQDMIHHQTIAYAKDGYRDTSSESCQSAYQCDSAHRTIPHS